MNNSGKREDYASWNQTWMMVAKDIANRSKDPHTQIGAVIVDPETNHLLGAGYVGMPRGISDDLKDIWTSSEKGNYNIHAELNAILNAKSNIEGAIMYLYSGKGYYPCKECAKVIAQKRISKVIIDEPLAPDDNHSAEYRMDISRTIFRLCNIEVEHYNCEG